MSKVRINVTVEEDLLREAKSYGVNLSAAIEQQLERIVAEKRRQRWLTENREALQDANGFVEKYGLWSDGKRQF